MLDVSSISILVVDDTPNNLRLLGEILESQRYHVRKSLSGKIALQSAYLNPPDLVLLDINMPEMNGYEVCQQLKSSEITRHIPIIFISALDQVEDKIQAFESGGQDYIAKPFEVAELLARVKNQLLIQQKRQLLLQKTQQLEQELEQELQNRQMIEAEVQKLNFNLEQQENLRMQELQKSREFVSTLQHIADVIQVLELWQY
ncbi:MAG: response regulator [Elainella sp. Prado103]|jgi:PleD family two-component response regulator|nr:response regulator [Elainella sp. Prado103]